MDPSGDNFYLAPMDEGVFFDGGLLAQPFSPAEQYPCGVCLPVGIYPIAQQYAKVVGGVDNYAVWIHESVVDCLVIADRKCVVPVGVAVC